MPKKIYFFLLLLTTLTFTACSTVVQVPVYPDPAPFKELNLLLTRTSASGTEFEQFKLGPEGDLFVECGKIRGGRYYADLQKFGMIPKPLVQDVQQNFLDILSANTFRTHPFDKPGNNSSLFDPGKFTLSFKTPNEKNEIATSLDAVSEPKGTTEKKLNNIATLLRRSSKEVTRGQSMCGNARFFGISG
jgi:hypothetical protein